MDAMASEVQRRGDAFMSKWAEIMTNMQPKTYFFRPDVAAQVRAGLWKQQQCIEQQAEPCKGCASTVMPRCCVVDATNDCQFHAWCRLLGKMWTVNLIRFITCGSAVLRRSPPKAHVVRLIPCDSSAATSCLALWQPLVSWLIADLLSVLLLLWPAAGLCHCARGV
jgi:hypothetical protein